MSANVSTTIGWDDTINYCEYHKPDLIYVAIGCSQKRYEYGKHSPQECPPFVRDWLSDSDSERGSEEDRIGSKIICILIDPDLEDDPYVLMDLSPEEMKLTRVITVRREFHWSLPQDTVFIHALCSLAINVSNTYLIVQDYSGDDMRQHYPIDRFGPMLLRKVVFDVSFMDGGCWVDFDKVRLFRDEDGAFLQPLYMPLTSAITIASPEVIHFIAERRYYALVSYVFNYYRHPGEREWYNQENVEIKLRDSCAAVAYGVPLLVTKENLHTLATRMIEDFARTAGAELTAAEIAHMMDEPTEKVLNSLSTLRLMINELST